MTGKILYPITFIRRGSFKVTSIKHNEDILKIENGNDW